VSQIGRKGSEHCRGLQGRLRHDVFTLFFLFLRNTKKIKKKSHRGWNFFYFFHGKKKKKKNNTARGLQGRHRT
jgi:hypothetical protein